MLYSEFIEGTGCNDNEHNFKVYKDLEVLYMNSDISKQEVYEYGKKLVDNSKSPEIIALEKEIKEQIDHIKYEIEDDQKWVNYYKEMKNITRSDDNKYYYREHCRMEKLYREDIKRKKGKIAELKWILAS